MISILFSVARIVQLVENHDKDQHSAHRRWPSTSFLLFILLKYSNYKELNVNAGSENQWFIKDKTVTSITFLALKTNGHFQQQRHQDSGLISL